MNIKCYSKSNSNSQNQINKICTVYIIFIEYYKAMNTNANANANVDPSNGINLVELAEQVGQYFIENITAISIVVVVLISALVYQQIMHVQIGADITENDAIGSGLNSGSNTKTVIVETFDNMDQTTDTNASDSDSLDAKLRAGFCKSHLGKPAELEMACSELSKNSCTATSCCVWSRMNSVESCVSGNKHGPIFKHGSNGAPKTLDYYYFENKCKGNCPTEK